jgi:hypothetical protein
MVTFVIPTREYNLPLERRLLSFIEILDFEDFEIVVLSSDTSLNAPSNKKIRLVIEESVRESFWAKFAFIGRLEGLSGVVVLMADDDLNFLCKDDISVWPLHKPVATSRTLMVSPCADGQYLIYEGWTHFSFSGDFDHRKEEVTALVGQGPASVYSAYRLDYVKSLSTMIRELLDALGVERFNLIEDCVNVVNLICGVHKFKKSPCLRILNSPPLSSRGISPSWSILREVSDLGILPTLIRSMSMHLLRVDKDRVLGPFSEGNFLGNCLFIHAQGYARARSRIWRDWVDVIFIPVGDVVFGVHSPHRERKWNPYYLWSGRVSLDAERFPPGTWISSKTIRNVVESLPDQYWADISGTE